MTYEVVSYINGKPVVVQEYKKGGWAYKAFDKRDASGIYDFVEFWHIDDDGTKERVFWNEKRKED